ncbi:MULTISPECIES: helix-turn-helix transcriptional regulator [Actinomadura]|uniref:AraC family transcriptional regulator n=1 Tax=Actinomadura yumaensis TaxID=111807 RepID=A0ABW2CKD1_9ACTN|nr:AraC family transcriptional regulator [Actinomadura sp. J1-007]MWK37096.1 helix-turn-helix domain-containing protein [Actinomadura sp. J1-007]
MSSPLRSFVITKSGNPVNLLHSATRLFGGAVTTSPLGPFADGEHEVRGIAAADFAVGYFASPLAVRVGTTPGRDSYFVNLGLDGEISASRGGDQVVLSRERAGVFNPGDAQELRPNRPGTRFLGLRIDAGLVRRELAALTGRPTRSAVRFDLPLDLSEPQGRAVKLLIESLIEQLDSGDPLFQREELRRSQLRCIVTALLLAQSHTHTAALRDVPGTPHPKALRAAVAFIEANLPEPLSLSRIAEAAGCSARTVSGAFRDNLGTSPMAYVRDLRLDRIRHDLLSTDDQIGEIAYRWGVTHLGRFAADYRSRFGELPSATTRG